MINAVASYNIAANKIASIKQRKSPAHVVTYSSEGACSEGRRQWTRHEAATLQHIASKIAILTSSAYIGEYDPELSYGDARLYFVPRDTLLTSEADSLGIRDQTQIFGGCVPFSFAANKSITHGLVDTHAATPPGWTTRFSASVRDVTLRGYSAFSKRDAYIAAERLLQYGDVRIKAPKYRGGNGQTIASALDSANAAIQAIDDGDCKSCGIVLETNLTDVVTRSVGTAIIGSMQISYCGTQFTTNNFRGNPVYGGSTLRAVRGDLSALLQLDWSTEEAIAIAQAMVYDFAAQSSFSGLFASRRNYDVAQGFDRDENFCSGVLEQSWRVGGASPAEIAAAELFVAEPQLLSVNTSCHEEHSIFRPPTKSTIYFSGNDIGVGAITKFVNIDAYEYRKFN